MGFVSQKTAFPFVVGIIDDASTDKTPEKIKSFLQESFDFDNKSVAYELKAEYGEVFFAQHKTNKNCFFAVILLEENHYSQNKSKKPYVIDWLSMADYLAICEGDDYWTDSFKLEKQIAFLDSHQDFVMCCTAFTQTVEGQDDSKAIIRYDKDEISIRDILQGIWIGTMTVVFRKDAIRDYQVPFPNLPMGDLPLWCHLALKGKIKYLKDVTSNYRRLNSSACHFEDEQKQYIFNLSAMRVREYYALLSDNKDVVVKPFAHNSHFYLDKCFLNRWFDFPIELLWHFITEYGHPSGYDKIKYWGLKDTFNYKLSEILLFLKGKHSFPS